MSDTPFTRYRFLVDTYRGRQLQHAYATGRSVDMVVALRQPVSFSTHVDDVDSGLSRKHVERWLKLAKDERLGKEIGRTEANPVEATLNHRWCVEEITRLNEELDAYKDHCEKLEGDLKSAAPKPFHVWTGEPESQDEVDVHSAKVYGDDPFRDKVVHITGGQLAALVEQAESGARDAFAQRVSQLKRAADEIKKVEW